MKKRCIFTGEYCIERAKVPVNGSERCCYEELRDEHEIALSLVDSIDVIETADLDAPCLVRISGRLSYAVA
ncbi:MAG: hypothetical protein R3302_02845, partial [Sulfurimonadaceae bacterium]|nr:hypothetical protein [Sulfurimonadaceae bacterium]